MRNGITMYGRKPMSLWDEFDSFFKPFMDDDRKKPMKTDIKETVDTYLFEIEAPGFEKEDINISVENGYMTISAEKKEKEEDAMDGSCYLRKERCVSYQRSYYIGDIDEQTIKAKYDKGILTIAIPKMNEKKEEKKKISIE